MKNNIFDMNCRKITGFYERQHINKLNWIEKFQLNFHVSFCQAGCKHYIKHSKMMDKVLSNYAGNKTLQLTPEKKKTMLERLNR